MRFPSFVDDLPLTRRALEFAAARHGGQERDADRAPFILHPLEVAHLLHGRDCPDEVVAAGVLHDTVEDAQVAVEELRVHFGERIAALVGAVTEPEREGPYPRAQGGFARRDRGRRGRRGRDLRRRQGRQGARAADGAGGG